MSAPEATGGSTPILPRSARWSPVVGPVITYAMILALAMTGSLDGTALVVGYLAEMGILLLLVAAELGFDGSLGEILIYIPLAAAAVLLPRPTWTWANVIAVTVVVVDAIVTLVMMSRQDPKRAVRVTRQNLALSVAVLGAAVVILFNDVGLLDLARSLGWPVEPDRLHVVPTAVGQGWSSATLLAVVIATLRFANELLLGLRRAVGRPQILDPGLSEASDPGDAESDQPRPASAALKVAEGRITAEAMASSGR